MSVVDELKQAGYREVVLPSGFRVRGVMPADRDLVRLRLVPGDLQAAVLAGDAKAESGSPLSDEERAARVEIQRIAAAAFIRAVWDAESEAWVPCRLTADDLNSGGMDPADVDALEDIVLYRRTPAEVTLQALRSKGEETAEALAAAEREAGDTVDAWSEFRDDGRGDGAGTGSESVEGPSVEHDRDAPRPRRAGGRPSAVVPPPPG